VGLIPTGALIFLVLGTIYLGVATPTEAAAFGVTGSLALAALGRSLTSRMLREAGLACARTTAMIMLILTSAFVLQAILALLRTPYAISRAVTSWGLTATAFLVVMILFYLVLGRRPGSMARAVNRLLEVRGGVVLVDEDRVSFELPMPLGGVMTRLSLHDAATLEDELRAALVARGYPHHEPLFTLFFLAADFLPFVRLSPRGVWDVKQGRVLLPCRARRP
jgi:hypothetical protein